MTCGSRGRGQGIRTPLLKNIGFLSNTGPDPLNHKAAKPTFTVGPSFKWRFAGGPMMARFKCYLDPLSPYQKNAGPPLAKLCGSAHA